MHFSQLLVLSVMAGVALSANVKNCPRGLKRNKYLKAEGEYCYQFVINQRKSFEDAQEQCHQFGGFLTHIFNEEENDYIHNMLTTTFGLTDTPMWIGLHHSNSVYNFMWLDGSEMEFSNFREEPEIAPAQCVAMMPKTGLWNVYQCHDGFFQEDDTNGYVCQYPMSTGDPTEPPTEPITVDNCPLGLERSKYLKVYNGKCYWFGFSEYKTFGDAQEFCLENGGNLAHVKSNAEDKFIYNKLSKAYDDYYEPVWIGLSYREGDERFTWTDGSSIGFSNFREDESHEGDRDECVALMPYDGKWESLECEFDEYNDKMTLPFVCEYSPVPIVQTTPGVTDMPPSTTQENKDTSQEPPQTSQMSVNETSQEPQQTTPMPVDETSQEPQQKTPMPVDETSQEPQQKTPMPVDETSQEPQQTTPMPVDETSQEPQQKTTMPVDETSQEPQQTTQSPVVSNLQTVSPCSVSNCAIDCGMEGYAVDPLTNCVLCKCNI